MDVGDARMAREFLRRCAALYEGLVARAGRAASRGDDEATLRAVALAARAAWSAHPGRYADGRIENLALEIGRRLDGGGGARRATGAETTRASSSASRRRVLHVATGVSDLGGHGHLIGNWIGNDPDSTHSLILLSQRPRPTPRRLAAAVAASGGELIALDEGLTRIEKARRLRGAARADVSLVVLHHNPDDPVPVVALAAGDCPPVAFMNHADHVFSLGASVSDLFLELREFGEALSARRFARRATRLPLPLDLSPPRLSRAEARALLGIPDEEIALLSIGAAYKFVPTEKHNFFRTARRLLAQHPAARLYLVGVGDADLARVGEARGERVSALGFVADPLAYELAADLYLESFPYNSLTAMLETAARGVCPVTMFAPTAQSDVSGIEGLAGLVESARDEAEYLARVGALVRDRGERERLGRAVGEQVRSAHGGEAWRGRLATIYRRLEGAAHEPSPLPAAGYAEEEADLLLGYYNRRLFKSSLLLSVVNDSYDDLTFGEIASLLGDSLRAGDTPLGSRQMTNWLGILKSKALNAASPRGGARA